MAKSKSTAAGRPSGSKTRSTIVDVSQSRCPKCDSTEREPYRHTTTTSICGVGPDGPYTHLVRRWTNCKKCGQLRVDRSCENRV